MAGCSGAGAPGNPIPGFGIAPAPATAAPEKARLTVRVRVTTGTANLLGFTLDGVTRLAVGPLPAASAGVGFLSSAFTVEVFDADNDTIVGTYASPVTLSDTDLSGATSVAATGSDDPPAKTLLSSTDIAGLVIREGPSERRRSLPRPGLRRLALRLRSPTPCLSSTAPEPGSNRSHPDARRRRAAHRYPAA